MNGEFWFGLGVVLLAITSPRVLRWVDRRTAQYRVDRRARRARRYRSNTKARVREYIEEREY